MYIFYLSSVNKSYFRVFLEDTASIGRELIFEGRQRTVYNNNNRRQFHNNIKYNIYNLCLIVLYSCEKMFNLHVVPIRHRMQ